MILNRLDDADDIGLDNGSLDATTMSVDSDNNTMMTKSIIVTVLSQIYLVALPLICVTGAVGNALAFFIFVSKPMRRTSCSLYLATRSFADGGFLFATFVTWSSDASRLRFFHTNGICQITIFLTFIFAFLSVWMTVVVTCENFIRICRPFSVSTFCNVRIARMCIFSLVMLSLLMYNYPLWTNYAHSIRRGNVTFHWCNTSPEYASLVKWLSFWDLLITLVIPSLVIVILMIFITASLIHSLKRQSRLQGGQIRVQRSNGNAAETSNRATRSSNSPQAKVTRMLFAVSLLFILLNSPSHIIRTKMTIQEFTQGVKKQKSPTTEEMVQVLFQIIYYLSFGVNLLVYLACGDNFRKVFVETYLHRCLRSQRNNNANEMTAMTTVRLEENDLRNEDQTSLLPSEQKTPEVATNNNGANTASESPRDEEGGKITPPPPYQTTDL